MDTQDLVDDLRRRGVETTRVELKSATGGVPKSLPETLSAFANTAGGPVLLGLDDDIQPVDIDVAAVRDALAGIASNSMDPPVRGAIEIEVIDDGNRIVRLDVEEASLDDKPCFVKTKGMHKGSYTRSGDGDHKLSDYEIDRLVENRTQPLHDRERITSAHIEDLDPELLAAHTERLRESNPRTFATLDHHEMLRNLGILARDGDRLVPTLGGLLTFGRYPQGLFPQLFISVVVYPGTDVGELGPSGERFLDNRSINGPLPTMAAEAITALTRNMTRAAVMQGPHRTDRLEYPIEVVRELIVNALMHRDYSPKSRGSQIQVELFADRLVVRSPGGFYGPVDARDFGAPDISSSRNALIAKLLSETRLPDSNLLVAENRGSGIPTIMRVLNAAGMLPPAFRADLRKVEVTVPHHALLTQEVLDWVGSLEEEGLTQAQIQALALLREGTPVSNQTLQGWGVHPADATRDLVNLVQRGLAEKIGDRRGASYRLAILGDTARDAPPEVAPGGAEATVLTARQRQILALIEPGKEVTANEITEAFPVSYGVIIKEINVLIEQGSVVATAPPRSRKRAYRRAPGHGAAPQSKANCPS